jgi:hypothetical protein
MPIAAFEPTFPQQKTVSAWDQAVNVIRTIANSVQIMKLYWTRSTQLDYVLLYIMYWHSSESFDSKFTNQRSSSIWSLYAGEII